MKYLTWALPSFWPLGTMLLPLKKAKGIQMTLLPEGKEQVLLSSWNPVFQGTSGERGSSRQRKGL